jgi:predicted MFS family arabinose efflux permease
VCSPDTHSAADWPADTTRLLALALVVAVAGFATLWPSTGLLPALLGLTLLGIGLGNLYLMEISLAVALAPEQSALASGRVVAVTSFAVLLAPLTVGTLADHTSLTVAIGIVPIMLVLAAAGLTLVWRSRTPASQISEMAGVMGDGSLGVRRATQSRRKG